MRTLTNWTGIAVKILMLCIGVVGAITAIGYFSFLLWLALGYIGGEW